MHRIAEGSLRMNDQTAADIRRHFDVVAESLRSEIRIVAENLARFQESTRGRGSPRRNAWTSSREYQSISRPLLL